MLSLYIHILSYLDIHICIYIYILVILYMNRHKYVYTCVTMYKQKHMASGERDRERERGSKLQGASYPTGFDKSLNCSCSRRRHELATCPDILACMAWANGKRLLQEPKEALPRGQAWGPAGHFEKLGLS